jgi:hypothetical protein
MIVLIVKRGRGVGWVSTVVKRWSSPQRNGELSAGYAGTSFGDVIERSGAPRGSNYLHFPGGKQRLGSRRFDVKPAAVRSQV